MPGRTVLVIEDDVAIRRGLADALDYAGYDVLQTGDGDEGLRLALEASVDLILLDVMLPGPDGFAILEQVRLAHPALPIVMVTAKGAEQHRVHGLKSGADDYITKPFSAVELLARVEAVLRRSPERRGDVRALRAGPVTLDLDRREASCGKNTCALTDRESDILRYLAVNHNRAVDRDALLHRVWGLDPRNLQTRTVDMSVVRLREKLAALDPDASFITTVRGKGYMLADGVEVTLA